MSLYVFVRLLGTMPMVSLKTADDAGPRSTRSSRNPTSAFVLDIRGRVDDLFAKLAEEPGRLVEADGMWQNRTFCVPRMLHRRGCWQRQSRQGRMRGCSTGRMFTVRHRHRPA
jgi:hypothetical protein